VVLLSVAVSSFGCVPHRSQLDLPARFSLCHAPRVELTAAVIDKASVMTSKKLPLRLDFVNADPHARGYYRALFKCGDDLRQDLLTLQVQEGWGYEGGRERVRELKESAREFGERTASRKCAGSRLSFPLRLPSCIDACFCVVLCVSGVSTYLCCRCWA
jgi:hypothetical protein